jgi:hypothetical protein
LKGEEVANGLNGKAKKENVGINDVNPCQLKVGTEIEMEHTDDERVAQQIALDHLAEFPDYYTFLVEMESFLKLKHGDRV